MFTINCGGALVSMETPITMGIINITPDSFYTSSGFEDDALLLAERMIGDGAAILDIGGQSTRPGSSEISAAEECSRMLPVISKIIKTFPGTIISVDTYYSSVAREAVAAGASMVNDISGGTFDNAMFTTVAALGVPYICTHTKGSRTDMHQKPHYDDVAREVFDFFITQTHTCRKAGIKDIIIDPGFGFAKTAAHNFELLKNLEVLKCLEMPILAGLSRKSTVFKTLGVTAGEALNGTTVLNTIALLNGASVLRVHDVREAREAIRLVAAYKKPLPV